MRASSTPRQAASARGGNLSPRTFLTFLAVGGFATALHYLLIALFVGAARMPFVPASLAGFAISAVVNYALTARITFRVRPSHRAAFPRFLLIAGCGLVWNGAVLTVLIGVGVPAPAAQIAATAFVLAWNYLVNALWTFRPRA